MTARKTKIELKGMSRRALEELYDAVAQELLARSQYEQQFGRPCTADKKEAAS